MAAPDSNPTNIASKRVIFPDDLISEGNARFMRMSVKRLQKNSIDRETAYDDLGVDIYLPMPVGITDEYNYNYTEDGLGPILAAVRDEQAGFNQETLFNVAGVGVATAAAAGIKATSDKVTGGSGGEFAIGLARAVGIQFNPGIFNNFAGFGFKVHSFLYILLPRSEKDSRAIADILGILRYYSAPSGANEGFIQRPEVFDIVFSQDEFLHKPGICYLRNMSVTYNPTKSAFFPNGAPSEVAIAMEFVEVTQNFKERQARDYPRYNFEGVKALSGAGASSAGETTASEPVEPESRKITTNARRRGSVGGGN